MDSAALPPSFSKRSLPTWLVYGLAISLVLIVAEDLGNSFDLLGPAAAAALFAAALVGLALVQHYRRRIAQPGVAACLLLAATAGLGTRAFGYDRTIARHRDQWERIRDEEPREAAHDASRSFLDLCTMARATAAELGSSDELVMASERPERSDRRAAAFRALAATELPRAHPRGAPGATLYDATLRPIAWTGENAPRSAILESHVRPVVSRTLVLAEGAETYLVAIEPVANGRGFVSVEIPIAADPRLENRYLGRYDALSAWAGRTVEMRVPVTEEQMLALQREFESEGEAHWGVEKRNFRFPLRCGAGDGNEILGVGTIGAEVPRTARLEARRRYAAWASTALVLLSGVGLLSLFRAPPHPLVAIAALVLIRLVVRDSGIPLGLGLDLDNPSHYASSSLFGFDPSPIDFLLTMLTLLAASAIVFRFAPRPLRRDRSLVASSLAPVVALAIFVGANHLVLDTWRNSSLGLSRVALLPFDPPRLAVQLGLLALAVAATLIAFVLLSWAETGPVSWRTLVRALAFDALLLVLANAVAPTSLRAQVMLSSIPLLAVHALALERRAGLAIAAGRALKQRFGVSFVFALLAAVSFYPAIATFEEFTIRAFIESTVAPVVLQHEKSRLYVMAETARAIDRMLDEGAIDLDREDVAYRIWVGTDLAVSSLSSSVEVVDPAGSVVSRFALSFPFVDSDPSRPQAPEEWIVEENRLPGEPSHPGYLLARRSVSGPAGGLWEIRFRIAADWRNLPFVSTLNPYLALFRSAGSESPPRFPYQELELFVLDRDGTPVFQSREGTLRPETALLRSAVNAPLWWEHPHELQVHRTYLFGDDAYLYALSYPEKPALTRAAELASWVLLAAGAVALVLGASLLLGAAGWPTGVTPADLAAGLGRSFYAKLFFAFVLIALVPIVLLAFLVRGVVVQQFQLEVEQEAIARARVVEKLIGSLEPVPERQGPYAAPLSLSDALLERVGNLAEVDVDVYREGELLATSKPELFASGLLKTRAVPSTFVEIVLEQLSQSIHRESVGSFEYMVVSVPLEVDSWDETGVISVPLASRQAEIDRKVASITQTVLLGALAFSIAAAALAYSLARRISGPINELTEATHRVAQGDLDVSLQTSQRDEIGALFASFTQMTEDLKQQRDDLERSKKLEAWAEMARQVAHEVKNPLTPIQLATEHLLRVHKDERVDFDQVLRECTETILEQVRNLRQISMEFSTFASPEPPKLEPVDLEELVNATISPYLQTPPDGVRFVVDASPAVPEVRADARLLKRTLVNLVENALHAVGGEGTVGVDVRRVEVDGHALAEIAVSDTGMGIDPEVKARVFEPYFSTKAAGTGLGLAIAKKVIEDHGGTIALESAPGEGTKVTLRLPASSGE